MDNLSENARISKEDRKFCETQQQNYEKSCGALYHIKELISALEKENQPIFFPEADEFVQSPYICLTSHQVCAKLDETHMAFIHYIVKYFETHYRIELDENAVRKALFPMKLSCCDCESKLLTLRYQDIVEQVFVQLNRRSFQDKAAKDLKNAARKGAWGANGLKLYKRKKAIVTIFAGYYDDFYGAFRLNNAEKNVIRALWHFECGRFDAEESLFAPLLHLFFNTSIFVFEMEKVKRIKCFKNGRVDIRFANKTYARQFVEEYLGTESPYI